MNVEERSPKMENSNITKHLISKEMFAVTCFLGIPEKTGENFKSKILINSAIQDHLYFKHLKPSIIEKIINSMFHEEFQEGGFFPESLGRYLFVVEEGAFEVQEEHLEEPYKGRTGKIYDEGVFLMRNNLKIKALTNCKVWILLQNAFRSIIKESGENIENLEFLKTFPWFRNVDDEVLSKISAANKLLYFGTNEVLDLQVNTLYIISKGNIKLIKKKIGLVKNKNISRVMSRGDHFEENTESSYDFIVFSPGVELLSFDMEYLQQLIGGSEYFRQETVAWGPFQNTGGLYREEFSEMKFEDLNILGNLGEGSFGRVDLVSYSKDPSKQFALKRVSKHRTVDIRQEGYVLDERKILFSCEHPFIIRLYKTFRSNRYIYMLFEAGHGGEVFEVMKKHDRFDNETARFISASALEALDYLHKRDIIYRDLKPDNMVIDRYGFVKLIDFGLSKHLGFTGRTWSFCGSPFIMAPEIILKIGHDRAVDIWAFGVLIYELLSGHNLFSTVNPMKAYSQIITGIEKVKFPYQLWGLPAEDLVRNLCKKEPNERLGYRRIDDIRKHRWFEGFNWSGLISQTMKPPKILVPKSQNIHAMNLVLNEDKPPPTPPKEMSNWDEIFA